MGQSVKGQLHYGFAFTSEGDMDYPPAWAEETRYGPELKASKMPIKKYEGFLTSYEEWSEDLLEYPSSDDVTYLLEAIIRAEGWKDVLEVDYHGALAYDFSAPLVFVKGFEMNVYTGETSILTTQELAPPRLPGAKALAEIAEILGVPEERIGWTMTAYIG